MTVADRDVVLARKTLVKDLAALFLPLERCAHDTATQASGFVAALLAGHRSAALPPAAGVEVIDLLSDAARLSLQARSKVMEAHVKMRELPAELGLAYSEPECPPDVVGHEASLRIVA